MTKEYIEDGLFAREVREELGCTSAELNMWAFDGRLPPDGVKDFARPSELGWHVVSGRAWRPETIEAAKAKVERWRAEEEAALEEKARTGRLRCRTCGRWAEEPQEG